MAARIARSAGALALRQGGVLLLGAVGAAAITRLLGASLYGQYASAIATWTLLGAAADFGFSLVLARDLAGHKELHRPMLRSAYQVGFAWSLVLAMAVAALGFAAGPASDRGIALFVLAPSMIFNGLNAARTLYIVGDRTRVLMWIDLITTTIQIAAMVAIAAAGLGPIAVAAAVSVSSILNSVAGAVGAQRLLCPPSDHQFSRKELIRRASPLGLLAIMGKVYLSIDLVILGWMVSGFRLGQYAAATKLLTVLASITGLVMYAALPVLSETDNREHLQELLAHVWHWLMVCAVPVFVLAAVFAPTVLHLSVGPQYVDAAGLLRVLTLAGVVSILSNFLGILMVSARLMRSLFTQTAAAIVLNVVGNVLLVPVIGVVAAAWMTAATEVLVCGCAVWSLRNHVSLANCVSVSVRPLLALAPAAGVAVLLHRLPAAGIPAFALIFLALVSVLGGWPSELVVRMSVLRRFA